MTTFNILTIHKFTLQSSGIFNNAVYHRKIYLNYNYVSMYFFLETRELLVFK